MTLSEFNALQAEDVSNQLYACCSSKKWLAGIMKGFPFADENDLVSKAEHSWYETCNEADWLEAFSHHPKIGDIKSLTEKFAGKEQESVGTAPVHLIEALATANAAYEDKFGFIFIVCATGKPAAEMLRLLQDRLANSREEELAIAMGEQHKITIIRLRKMLVNAQWQSLTASQLTTHVLDTSLGKPGKDITIRLKRQLNNGWRTMAQGVTNSDGRIADLLPPGRLLKAGNYRMQFETGAYFDSIHVKGFYPSVEIEFTVFDDSHYHVPLLINPYGYSTYRGS